MTPAPSPRSETSLDVHLCLLCTQPFLGQKARPPWSSRLVCWGGWSTQCRPGLRGVEGLTRAAQCGTIAACAGTHHRAPRRCAEAMYWQQAEAVQYPAEPGPRDHPTHTPATCRTIPDAFTPQVDMCRQAVAAAAAAFGKPGGLSGQTRASPFEQPRGGGGLPRQHVPVAPSPFDSQLVQNSLRAEPELMRSFSATLGDGSTYVPPSGSTFQCVRGRSALRASESLDSEG
eukprot:scaffold56097_cov33-Phaeocystis_antarctica.AAC.1